MWTLSISNHYSQQKYLSVELLMASEDIKKKKKKSSSLKLHAPLLNLIQPEMQGLCPFYPLAPELP